MRIRETDIQIESETEREGGQQREIKGERGREGGRERERLTIFVDNNLIAIDDYVPL